MSTVTCPRCGGGETQSLAPNYFECQSQVVVNVIPAGAQGNYSPVPLYGPCGQRFQSGPAGPDALECACGMFSVGRCRTCSRPLCGEHVVRRGGRVLCGDDAAAEQRAEEAASAAQAAAGKAAAAAALETWENEVLEAMTAVVNPVERYVRLLAMDFPPFKSFELRAMASPHEDSEVAQWFVRVVTAPPQLVTLQVKSLFATSGSKEKQVPGWPFAGGSTARHSLPYGESEVGCISVTVDGSVVYGSNGARTRQPQERFNVSALRRMLGMTKLDGPSIPPRPSEWEPPANRSTGLFF